MHVNDSMIKLFSLICPQRQQRLTFQTYQCWQCNRVLRAASPWTQKKMPNINITSIIWVRDVNGVAFLLRESYWGWGGQVVDTMLPKHMQSFPRWTRLSRRDGNSLAVPDRIPSLPVRVWPSETRMEALVSNPWWHLVDMVNVTDKSPTLACTAMLPLTTLAGMCPTKHWRHSLQTPQDREVYMQDHIAYAQVYVHMYVCVTKSGVLTKRKHHNVDA